MVVDRRGPERSPITTCGICPTCWPAGDRLVLNNTKVIRAQLAGVPDSKRAAVGRGCLSSRRRTGIGEFCARRGGELAPGEAITLRDREGRAGEKLWLIERLEEGQWLAHVETDEATETVLERVGRVPLPPYIRGGNMVDEDVANYQTVYAERPGAIAAPTAGLHFTRELLKTLSAHGVEFSRMTLHVGSARFGRSRAKAGTNTACTASGARLRRQRRPS